MVESTRFRRVLSLLFFFCMLPAMPAEAQTLISPTSVISPPSATLESANIGEPASTTFTISPYDTIAGVYLCVPSCSNENYASGSGTVQDGESEWGLDGSACLSVTSESTCEISVTYTAGDASVSTAELQVDMGFYSEGVVEGGNITTETAALTGKLREQQPGTLQFAQDGYTVDEGGTVDVVVQRVGGIDGSVSVRWYVADFEGESADGTASDNDYQVTLPPTDTLTWEDGDDTTRTIRVAATADQVEEQTESLTLVVEGSDTSTDDSYDTTDVAIIDVPARPGTARFTQSTYRVTEGNSIDVLVERVDGSDGELSVRWSVDEGGTAGDTDYRLISAEGNTLRWGEGDTEPRRITVDATLDEIADEPPETFSIRLESDAEDCCDSASGLAEITIDDATPPPSAGTVQFVQSALSVEENAGPVTLTLTRTDGSDGVVIVDYNLIDGTATFGEDYGDARQGTSGRVTWTDDDSEPKTIAVAIAEDLVREPTAETFRVALSLPIRGPDDTGPQATLGAADTANVSIVDTTPPPDTVALARASHAVDEGAGALDVVIRRLGGGTGAASVDYRLVAGSATTPLDFLAPEESSGRVSWPAGETADRTVTIRIVDDRVPEPDETFSLVLDAPVNASVGEPGSTEITIIDNDPPGLLEFDATRYTVAENEGSVTLTVSRTGGNAGPAAVRWATSDRTAEAGEDYARLEDTARAGILEWAAGVDGTRTITLDIAEDELVEGEENFVVTLSNASGAALGATQAATVLIGDTTVIELDQVRFATAATRVAESAGSVQLVVQRVGSGEGPVSIRYTLDPGTTTAGDDTAPETPSTGTLAWNAGDTEDRVIGIGIENDELVEEDELFTLTLSEPVNAAIGSPASNEVTIVDDDVTTVDPGTLRFTSDDVVVDEDDGQVTFGVERIDGTDGAVSVLYETVDAGATGGRDYTAASATLSWADGEAGTRLVTIDIATDNIVEEDERFLVQLREATTELGEELPLATSEIAVTIADTTRIGTLVVLDTRLDVQESAGAAVVRLSRNGGDDGERRARYEVFARSAAAGEDFTPVEGVLEWKDGESGVRELRVPVLNDATDETDETFVVRFFDTPPVGTNLLVDGEVTVTIIDDDNGLQDPTIDPLPALGSLRLVIMSGDGQSGLPGDVLEPMLADVIDESAAEARRSNIPVTWTVNPAGSAEFLEGFRTVSDDTGGVRNRVRILSRGFLNVVATIDVAGSEGGVDAPPSGPTTQAEPGEAVFLVRAGLFVAAGLNGNQAETGRALDAACDALDAAIENGEEVSDGQLDLFDTCRELEARLDDGRLPSALDRLAPEELFAIADSIIDTTDIQVTNVYARINAIRGERRGSLGGTASGALDLGGLGFELYGEHIPGIVVDAAKNSWTGGSAAADGKQFGSRLGFFVNGTISFGTVDSDGNQARADVSTRGLTVGADVRLSAAAVVGVGLGIVANETEFTPDDGNVDANGVNLTLFGTWYEEDSGYLDGVLDIGRNTYDVRRRINLPGLADQFGVGDTEADVLSLTLGAGKDTAYGDYELGPYVRASHTRAAVGGYSERATGSEAGAGSVLDIRAHDIRSTRLAIGGQLSRTISTRRGVIVPQFRIETQFEFDERKKGITASFQHDPEGTPFTVNGDKRDSGYLNIGLGASAVFANGRSGYLFYETRAAHEYITQHWLKAGVRLEF